MGRLRFKPLISACSLANNRIRPLAFGIGWSRFSCCCSAVVVAIRGRCGSRVVDGGGTMIAAATVSLSAAASVDESSHLLGPQRVKVARCCGLRRSNFLLLIYVVFYVCFLIAGAVSFLIIEGHWDDSDDDGVHFDSPETLRIRGIKEAILSNNECLSEETLEEFIIEIIMAHRRGVSAVRNVTMEPNWSFGQSLFFSATIITTIGYGHVTPLSEGGKIFCIVYALLGIPLTLILLTAFVERLMIPTTILLQFLNSRLGHLYQPFNIRLFHLSIIVAIVLIFFYIVPSFIFAAIEPEWDFLDSLYYCIISLTTIGLGDYVPGDASDQPYRLVYKICTTGFLLIGLTFMMLVLTVFYDIPQLNFGLFFLLRSDEHGESEKTRLHGPNAMSGPKYTPQIDENVRHNIRVKPRGSDLSSPEDGRP